MKRLILILQLLVVVFPGAMRAQTEKEMLLGVDELFTIARQRAFNGHRAEARVLLKAILQRSPDYVDVRVLLGRTYAWDGMYDSARIELRRALKSNPSSVDAYEALIDDELWSDHPEAALGVADEALKRDPNNDELLVKKAVVLRNLGRDYEALTILARAEDVNPANSQIADLREQIRSKSMYYSLSANYTGDRFSDIYDPMHLGYLQLSRRTAIGSVFARVNYGYRFKTPGYQEEVDFYPRIKSGIYAYLNYGYSEADIFPRHRAGGELYGRLPSSMEGSLGFRYLYFGPGSEVTIYTGSLNLYVGDYYFSFRPYITPGSGSFSRSGGLLVRRYFSDADSYVYARGSIGYTPDERDVLLATGVSGKEIYFLKSQNGGVGFQYSVTNHYVLSASYDLTHQELSFSPGSYVYDNSYSAGIKYIF
ncbi:MAG TPA: YaiO family outer membrane beta-barrel protein [Bacteroidota bacterium]|nr:YaiO family outer membrane beta-barrel protein [Bacteroidota bacterium]